MSKLGTFVKYAVVATASYYVGKMGLNYFREKAGMVVGKVVPKAQMALTAGYAQAMAITNGALERAGVNAQVTPGVVDGQASLIVKTPEGTDPAYVAENVPPVAAGMPVVVQ
jgi:hypothetical protein